jgi:HPt (histidine-containing phosphotransfer) domain-containing protein
MKGDRDRCLEAGMDAYVSKPIRARDLYETIDLVVAEAAIRGNRKPQVRSDDVVDWEEATEAVQGDMTLLRELVEIFLDEYPQLLEQARDALSKADAPGLQRAARTLKGSVRLFGARGIFDLCYELETLAKEGRLGSADQPVARLEDEVRALAGSLQGFLAEA